MDVKVHLNNFCLQFVQLVYQKGADKAWIISVTGGDDNTAFHCCFQLARGRPLLHKQGTSQSVPLLSKQK